MKQKISFEEVIHLLESVNLILIFIRFAFDYDGFKFLFVTFVIIEIIKLFNMFKQPRENTKDFLLNVLLTLSYVIFALIGIFKLILN